MDTPIHHERALLLQAVLEMAHRRFAIRGKILSWEQRHGQLRADALVQLSIDEWNQKLPVEIKTGLRPQSLGIVIDQIHQYAQPSLLVTDYVSPPMAETLKRHGIWYLDAAGNAYIESPPVHIWIKGERLQTADLLGPQKLGRAFSPSGLKVLLLLLIRPDVLTANYREIALMADVAHGTVGWVVPDLEKMGFISRFGNARRLVNIESLFERWAEAYLRVLRPKLLLGRYRTELIERLNLSTLGKYDIALGGDIAGAHLTKYLKSAHATFYVNRIEPRMIAEFRMSKHEFGNIEFLRRFWSVDRDEKLAPIPVVYADLMGTGDARNFEIAKIIRGQFFARPK